MQIRLVKIQRAQVVSFKRAPTVESGSRWTTIQRRYGEEDIPAIFAILSELVERRESFKYD